MMDHQGAPVEAVTPEYVKVKGKCYFHAACPYCKQDNILAAEADTCDHFYLVDCTFGEPIFYFNPIAPEEDEVG